MVTGDADGGWGDWARELRDAVEAAARERATEAMLLSGGLDTSILAAVLAVDGRRPLGVTVVLRDADHPDLPFATRLADELGLDHEVLEIGEERLEEAIRHTVEALGTYDPMTVRNQAVIAVALERIVELGPGSAMTGDGADELFAGYSFYRDMDPDELRQALERLWPQMSFDSLPMGRRVGLHMEAPYLDERVRAVAERLPSRWLVGPAPPGCAGVEPGEGSGKIGPGEPRVGKWILRKAFEEALPEGFAWRRKDPIEVGSGSTELPERYAARIDEDRFRERAEAIRHEHGVRIRDPEHLRYFEVYVEVHGSPEPAAGSDDSGRAPDDSGRAPDDSKRCPDCRLALPSDRRFCKRCGAWPV